MPFAKAPVLVDVHWLSQHLHDPLVVVLDCRWRLNDPEFSQQAYRAGHIPGARSVRLDRDLSAAPGRYGGRHPLLPPQDFEAAMAALGVGADSYVIAYDDDAAGSARLWWCLSFYGHERVSILDGGLPAWMAAGLPLSDQESLWDVPTRPFRASPDPALVVDYQSVRTLAGCLPLIDARAPERFAGVIEPVDRVGGHIPGAVNIPYQSLLRDDGRFRDARDLRRQFAPVLEAGSSPIVYCGSGVTACVVAAGLNHIGAQPIVYPGSWSDWIQHEDAPIATGEDAAPA